MSATGTAAPPPLPAEQEHAHTALLALLDQHQEHGHRIPCRGPHAGLWVAETHAATRAALTACADCPALTACHDYAQAFTEPAGVWGGTTPTGRARTRRTPHRMELTEAS